jgi:hypothetical protein
LNSCSPHIIRKLKLVIGIEEKDLQEKSSDEESICSHTAKRDTLHLHSGDVVSYYDPMMVAGSVGSHRVTQIMSIVAMSRNDNEADNSDDDAADNENESSLTLRNSQIILNYCSIRIIKKSVWKDGNIVGYEEPNKFCRWSRMILNYELVPGNTQILCDRFGIKLNDNGTIEERARKLHKKLKTHISTSLQDLVLPGDLLK